MFKLGNIHLWFVGGAAFVIFANAELNATQADEISSGAKINFSADEGAPDIRLGENLYARRCGACHSIDINRIGPRHRGVVGRQAGSLSDFDYSNALRDATFIWDNARLNQWLANPESLVPGQKMGFRLADEGERAAIIAYMAANPE